MRRYVREFPETNTSIEVKLSIRHRFRKNPMSITSEFYLFVLFFILIKRVNSLMFIFRVDKKYGVRRC